MEIKVLPYNALEVNCYVCYGEDKHCVIIDPSCGDAQEHEHLMSFLRQKDLQVDHIIITHAHIDHIIGSDRVCRAFGLPLTLHKAGLPLVGMAFQHAEYIGLHLESLPEKHAYVEDGDKIIFGTSCLKVLYTPGHADGSICLYSADEKTVFTGDVLFNGSIGRTDLMTGNLDTLRQSIFEKLFVLGDDVTVRPGHGGRTNIEHERHNNPFL